MADKDEYIEVPFLTLRGYKVPLLKVEIDCPKLGGRVLVYALPDSGSRFSLINRKTLTDCFDSLEDRFVDFVALTNLNVITKRYRLQLHFLELGESFEIPLAVADFGEMTGVFPSLVLGRDDFFSRVTICFVNSSKLIVSRRTSY